MVVKKKKINITLGGKNTRCKLKPYQTKYLKQKLEIKDIELLDGTIIKFLKEKMKTVTDYRQKSKTSYKLWDILVCVILASFANNETWYEIHDFIVIHYSWLRQFLKLTGGIPTRQTIERVMSLVNKRELEETLTSFFISITTLPTNDKDILNVDGRVDCGSSRHKTLYNEEVLPLNSLNVYSNNYGICLASEKIDEKTNEIPNVPIVLSRLNIKDTIVTWDALNTQVENIKTVITLGGDYVAPIKANQGNFYNDLVLYFEEKKLEMIIAGNTDSSYHKEIEKSHSYVITYEYFQTNDISWYFDIEKWEGVKTFGLVKKTIEKANEKSVEFRYYISSLNLDISLFSKAIRNHWSVENKLHWHLDFTFREDYNTTMNKDALFNLQLVNKFCLGVLNKVKPYYDNISLQRIRKVMAAKFEEEFVNLVCFLLLS